MQISCRCAYCGYIHISEKDNDLCLEIDFAEERMRIICLKCKKENSIQVSHNRAKKTQPLPGLKMF